jgi:pyridoxal phosphate enzyme (YggS family)
MVANELIAVRTRIRIAAERAGRDPDSVTLVAVSKGHDIATVMDAYEAGQRDFGENRAAELAAKAPQLPEDIRWHFIGSLQTRQAKIARPFTTLLHSLDRSRLINAWVRDAGVVPAALLQVNVSGEVQKHGAHPDEAEQLLEEAEAGGIKCVGLMTMAPLAATAEASRPWFVELRKLRNRLVERLPEMSELSMGMTDDFEVAIEEGATLIRVGRAIFGPPGVPATSD